MRDAAHGGSEGTEHPELRAIIAIVRVEGVADEAAVAGLSPEQADLSLELNRRRGKQRNAKADARVADCQPRGEIVAAVDHEVMTDEQFAGILRVDPLLHGFRRHKAVQALYELQGEIRLGIAGVSLAKQRMPVKVG